MRVSQFRLNWLALLLCAAFPVYGAAADGDSADPAGHWSGVIDIPGSPLEITVFLEQADTAWTGTIDIPAQGAAGLELEEVDLDGETVRFSIRGIPGNPSFSGQHESEGITGEFTQGGQAFDFRLSRKAAALDDVRDPAGAAVFEDPMGRYTVPVPVNWQAREKDDYLVLADRDETIRLSLVVVDEADAPRAIERAWERVDPDFSLEVIQTLNPPSRPGIQSTTVVNYDLPDERVYQGFAQTHQGVNFVLLIAGDLSAIQRRNAQINVIASGLKILGVEEIDLAGVAPEPVADIVDELESFVEKYLDAFGIPGASVAIVQDGKQVYGRGFGYRRAGEEAPMTTETRMMIGSTGKTLTTLLMASLVDEGIIEWDTPAIEIFPEFAVADPDLSERITLRNLVCACTGVPRRDFEVLFNGSSLDAEAIVRSLADFEFFTDFGETFQYSNQLVASGGYLAALADGAGLADLAAGYRDSLRTRILEPLGMNSTHSSFGEIDKSAPLAHPHQPAMDSGRQQPMEISAERILEAIMPAGSHWSTADDLARYMIAQMAGGVNATGDRIVSRENLDRLWQPQVSVTSTASYGLGWMVGEYHGLRELSHGGNTLGFSSEFSFLPEAGIGIVILTNSRATNAFGGAVHKRLYELVFGLEIDEAESGARFGLEQMAHQREEMAEKLGKEADPDLTDAWLGRHYNRALGEIRILRSSGQLEMDAGEFRTVLRPLFDRRGELDGYMSYTPPMAGLLLRFEKSEDTTPIIRFGEGMNEYRFEPVES